MNSEIHSRCGARKAIGRGEDDGVKRVKARKKLSTAQKITALSEVGGVLLTELDETRLVRFIAQTACDLTGAAFAAFSPLERQHQPLSARLPDLRPQPLP